MNEFPLVFPPHGGQLRQIAARFEVPIHSLTDFSANINPDGPPSSVIAAIRQSLDDPATLAAYPDLDLVELKQTIAGHVGIQPENVAIANGFVPLLEAALRSFNIQRCLLPVPSFSEYKRTLENSDVTVTPHSLSPDENFLYEPDTLLNALLNHSCDAILLANPQNPSGVLCTKARMRRLIEMAAQHAVTVLLDEAFIDYCPFDSLTHLAMEQPNVIVFRSVTKFFAIPGLRVAYAAAKSSTIKAMNRLIAPWPITTLASNAVCAALNDGGYIEKSRATNERRRLWLEQELARLEITTYPSSANFLLLRFPAEIDVRLLWEKLIVQERLVLRSCENFEGLTDGHLRIAVRSEPENEGLIRGLKRVLSGLAG